MTKTLFWGEARGSRSQMPVGIPCIRNGRGGWGVLVGVWCSHVLDTISTNPSVLASHLTPALCTCQLCLKLLWVSARRLTLSYTECPSCVFWAACSLLSNHRFLASFHFPHIGFNLSSTSVLFIVLSLFCVIFRSQKIGN